MRISVKTHKLNGDKLYYIVYITSHIDTSNKMQYVGAHATYNLNDTYIGSGTLFSKVVKQYGKKEFKREILGMYETEKDMFNAEIFWIKDKNTIFPNGYNIASGGYWGTAGLVVVRDINNNCFDVFANDPRYLSGELISASVVHMNNCPIHGRKYVDKHQKIKRSVVPKKYKINCPECIKFYLSDDYIPNENDINLCHEFLNEFKFTKSSQYSELYFKDHIPQFYKIIKEFNIDNLPFSFAQKIFLMKNNITSRPKCKKEGCNNFGKLDTIFRNKRVFLDYCCKEHLNESKVTNMIKTDKTKTIKCTNIETNEILYFKGLSKLREYLKISTKSYYNHIHTGKPILGKYTCETISIT